MALTGTSTDEAALYVKLKGGDAVPSSHFAKNGRDIWASMHFGAELSIGVADIGGNLAAMLAKECHLPLDLKLSQARADAVRSWLGSHGIAAGRMATRGYGRNQDVADNGTVEGRAGTAASSWRWRLVSRQRLL